MKQNLFLFVSLMLIAFVIVSCKIGFDTQVYRFIPSIDSDIYYILMSDTKNFNLTKYMYYHFTRIDLIQVDNVIHGDCL